MPPKGRKPKATVLPPMINSGFEINIEKASYCIDHQLAVGGFGRVYELRAPHVDKVVKVENETGPINIEIQVFIRRLKKAAEVKDFVKRVKCEYLALVPFYGFTPFTFNDTPLKCVVIDRLQQTIDNVSEPPYGKTTAFQIAYHLLNALQFLHEHDIDPYTHNDIKPANIMFNEAHRIFLVDFGLAIRRRNKREANPKAKHDGTLEYASIDAHEGVQGSTRSDVEILGYNLLKFVAGSLPWTNMVPSVSASDAVKEEIAEAKRRFRDNLDKEPPHDGDCVKFLKMAMLSEFDKINYEGLRKLCLSVMKQASLTPKSPIKMTKEAFTPKLSVIPEESKKKRAKATATVVSEDDGDEAGASGTFIVHREGEREKAAVPKKGAKKKPARANTPPVSESDEGSFGGVEEEPGPSAKKGKTKQKRGKAAAGVLSEDEEDGASSSSALVSKIAEAPLPKRGRLLKQVDDAPNTKGGAKKPAATKTELSEESGEDEAEEKPVPSKPKKQKLAKGKAAAVLSENEDEVATSSSSTLAKKVASAPAAKRGAKKKQVAAKAELSEEDGEEEKAEPIVKKPPNKKKKPAKEAAAARLTDENSGDEAPVPAEKKKPGKAKPDKAPADDNSHKENVGNGEGQGRSLRNRKKIDYRESIEDGKKKAGAARK